MARNATYFPLKGAVPPWRFPGINYGEVACKIICKKLIAESAELSQKRVHSLRDGSGCLAVAPYDRGTVPLNVALVKNCSSPKHL